MADDEYEQIKAARMAELKSQFGGGGGGGMGGADAAQQAEQAKQQEERRQTMVMQVITAEARERLSRIALVKPDKARQVENMILQMATSGRLGGRVTEEQLIKLLEQISEADKKKNRVIVQRRRYDEDD
eukprot:gnl/Hemi2/7866_TR2716_c0_g1_i2.p1 gnl/Hemi2/7866_TR2716_c0_g1~~gnl/Hemi2/7866_TR2716_c0_g1_i2.p1  ORF type:complete len:129 (-),score=50.55 gnl/Hemi2/7866_TR2716_c0_g1_i2:262-648(-)